MSGTTVRVLLVDDHRLFRSGVRSELLDADAGLIRRCLGGLG